MFRSARVIFIGSTYTFNYKFSDPLHRVILAIQRFPLTDLMRQQLVQFFEFFHLPGRLVFGQVGDAVREKTPADR